MKPLILSLLFSLFTLAGYGQTFYVEPTEKGFEERIVNNFEFNSIKTTKEKEAANYIVKYYFQKVKSINVGTYEAFIRIEDSEGNKIFETSKKKKQANAYNGYNAVPAVLDILCKKELIPKIQKGLI